MNKVILMGRIASDLELKTTPNGVSVCTFRLAVDRDYQKKGEEKVTDFLNIVAWRATAELIVKWFAKGKMLAIEGAMQARPYTDKNGNPATWYEVVVEKVHFTGEKCENSAPQAQNVRQTAAPKTQQQGPPLTDDDDDYPF